MKDTLLGQRFCRWLVIRTAKKRGKHPYWLCRCDCGTEREVNESSLIGNGTNSCGCYRKEITRGRSTIHGHNRRGKKSREFSSWNAAKKRATWENEIGWESYGGRGITMCDRWLTSFENFLADMGPRPQNTSLERVDNDKGYQPDNCIWANLTEQANNKRSNVHVVYNEQNLTLMQLANTVHVDYKSLWYFWRKRNLPIEEAVRRAAPRRR